MRQLDESDMEQISGRAIFVPLAIKASIKLAPVVESGIQAARKAAPAVARVANTVVITVRPQRLLHYSSTNPQQVLNSGGLNKIFSIKKNIHNTCGQFKPVSVANQLSVAS